MVSISPDRIFPDRLAKIFGGFLAAFFGRLQPEVDDEIAISQRFPGTQSLPPATRFRHMFGDFDLTEKPFGSMLN
jgi:hypothetical protein